MNAQVATAVPNAALNMQSNRFLVGTPNEVRFLEMSATEAGRKAFLGDAEHYDTQVGSSIINSQIQLRDSVEKIERLVHDESRTEVAKHGAAEQVANSMVQRLADAKAKIEARSKELLAEGEADADAAFAPKLERSALDAEIRRWIREQAKTPEGLPKIRAAMERNGNVAAVIYHSEDFLLNLAPEVHNVMKYEVVARYAPAAYKKLTDSVALSSLAPNYEKAINSVRKSFYSTVLALKAKQRVEI